MTKDDIGTKITEGELQSELGWLTTAQIGRLYQIPRYMVYRWGERLSDLGLARRTTTLGPILWLLAPSAALFLKARKGRSGRYAVDSTIQCAHCGAPLPESLSPTNLFCTRCENNPFSAN